MSLATQLSNLITRIGTEFKSVRSSTGSLTDLSTVSKSSLVAAINELKGSIAGASGIDDGVTSTTTSYSSQKTIDLLNALKAEILGGASGAYDTLKELEDMLASGTSGLDALNTAIGNRVRFDAAQALTTPQKTQALANIGAIAAADVGDVTTDFVALFNAAVA